MTSCAALNPALPDLDSLSLAQQVAQLVMVRASGHLFDHQRDYPHIEATAAALGYWLGELGIGSVILLGGSAAEVGLRSQQLQSWATLPLLIAADIEEGVGQRFAGATWFPPPMALGAIAQQDLPLALTLAEQMGAITAQEALAIGLNWILAPVVDVNNNPANPVINVRAFGETVPVVSQLTAAFIRGAQQQPILTTAKHFPGHGDTATDSHLQLPTLSHDLSRLDAVELPPFRSAIAAGVDGIMTAHVNIPALDAAYPATLSAGLLTGMLRQELGFQGLIVTDALVMGAIAQRYDPNEAAVLAVEAGADVLVMPADPEKTIRAICDAVTEGRLSADRIRYSAERVWRAKHKVGSNLALNQPSRHAWEHLPPPPVQIDQVAQPKSLACARAITQAACQTGGRLPLQVLPLPGTNTPAQPRNLVVVDQAWDCPFLGRTAPAIAVPQRLGYGLQVIDPQAGETDMKANAEHRPTLLQLFIRGNPFRGSAAPTQIATDWFHALLASKQLQALLIYGSPYVLNRFLPHLPPELPHLFCYGQMPSAQQVMMERLFDQEQLQSAQSRDRAFTT